MGRRGVHLNDVVWMCDPSPNQEYPDHANARQVYAKLEAQEMPPDQPWAAADLALYNSWMGNGFQP